MLICHQLVLKYYYKKKNYNLLLVNIFLKEQNISSFLRALEGNALKYLGHYFHAVLTGFQLR